MTATTGSGNGKRRTRNTAADLSEGAGDELATLEVAGGEALTGVDVRDGTLEELLTLPSLRLTLGLLRGGKLSTLDASGGLGALLEGSLVRVEGGGRGAAGKGVGCKGEKRGRRMSKKRRISFDSRQKRRRVPISADNWEVREVTHP